MSNIEERRNYIISILNNVKATESENVETLSNYLKINKFCLNDINDEDFDILIYSIEMNISPELIKFIINNGQYETFNYTFDITDKYVEYDTKYLEYYDDVEYLVPLFSAIRSHNFEIADLLIKSKKADINYLAYEENIVAYLYNYFHINKTIIKYILRNGLYMRGFPIGLINCLMYKSNKEDLLRFIFENYIYDDIFILKLLTLHKQRVPLSDSQIDNIIMNEKAKIKINDDTYQCAIETQNIESVITILKYDSDPSDIIVDRIHRFNLLEISRDNLRYVNDNHKMFYNFVKDIIKHKIQCGKQSVLEQLFMEAKQRFDVDIILSAHLKNLFTKKKIRFNYTGLLNENLLLASSHVNSIKYMDMLLFYTLCESNDPEIREKMIVKESKEEQDQIIQKINDPMFSFAKEMLTEQLKEALEATNPLSVNFIKNADTSFISLLINIAVKIEKYSIVKYLVEHEDLKGQLDLNTKDKNGEYPLVVALSKAKSNNDAIDILQYMIEHGGYCNIYDNKNMTINLLDLALQSKKYIAVKYLLDQERPNLRKKLENDSTLDPFLRAIVGHEMDKVKMLLTTIQDDLKYTHYHNKKYYLMPLTLSYILNEKDILKYLVEKEWPINELDEYGYSVLHYMVIMDDVEMVNYLISNSKANVNLLLLQSGVYGNSALDISINNHNKEILLSLIHSPTLEINQLNQQQELLLYAVMKNEHFSLEDKLEIIQYLLEKGSAIDRCNNEGDSYLGYAIKYSTTSMVQLLVEHGADVNYVDWNKNSPLSYAILMKSEPIVSLLLEHGAEADFVDIFDYSLLAYAINEYNILNIIKMLVEHGADVNFEITEINYERKESKKLCMLLSAIDNYEFSYVQYLMEHGVNYDFKNSDSLKELFRLLIAGYRPEYLRYFLDSHFIEVQDIRLEHFDIIFYGKKIELLEILIDHHLDLELSDEDGETMLVKAVSAEQYDMAKYLLDLGAKMEPLIEHVNVVESLLFLCKPTSLPLMELLIQRGLDVNQTYDEGTTLLIKSIQFSNLKSLKVLLNAGANPSYVNEHTHLSVDGYNERFNARRNNKMYHTIKNLLDQYKQK